MNYQIEKEIAIPALSGSRKYPWPLMSVGDSFLHPLSDESDDEIRSIISRFQAAAGNYRHRTDSKFRIVMRRVDDGIRVWRMAPK